MKVQIKDFQLSPEAGGGTVSGVYGEIQDYVVRKSDKPKSYIVTFILDIHMPEPFGGFRRDLEREFIDVPNLKLLKEFLDTYLL